MRRVGIVDLGSNTARLVVFDFEPGKWFRLADQLRQPVRLGEGLGRRGRLTREAQVRAAKALELFADYATSTGLSELEVLGTSALRDAENQAEFLERIRPLNLEVSILTGEDEAALGVLAVANGFELRDAWVIDIGGGSAQVSLMVDRRFVEGGAFPLGAVRLTESFLDSDPPTAGQVRRLERAVADRLGAVARRLRRNPLPLVAMGGTIRNLARAVQKERRYPLQHRIHGYYLHRPDLESLVDRLINLEVKRRDRVPGIKADRADVIVAGGLTYRWLLREGGVDGVWISGLGLREGAMLRRFLPPPHLVEDLRSFSVRNLLQHYSHSKERIELTRRLSARLFDGLRDLHGFSCREADLLDAAAILQDIGMAVNYYRHDQHGAYLVAAAPLNGFTHREQALLALLVRYHLRGKPRLREYERLCEPGDARLVRVLAACLRIADHLERTRARRVQDLEVEVRSAKVVLRPLARESLSLELWDIDQHQELFEAAFGRRLVVEPRRVPATPGRDGSPGSVTGL